MIYIPLELSSVTTYVFSILILNKAPPSMFKISLVVLT